MKNRIQTLFAILLAAILFHATVLAHGESKNVKLHVNPTWKECSFQLDPSLTQQAWHQFTEEAGVVSYFRPLTDAKPMGTGNYEFSMLQWSTTINDADAAWNDTFVHPDSTHWLKEGEQLPIPGFTFRTGITSDLDLGVYWIKNPDANYGFWGGQLQYGVLNDAEKNWAVSVRASIISLYGPADLDLSVYGADVLASRQYDVYSDWVTISPYAGVSTYLSSSHETTAAVNLHDENIAGVQGMVGAVTQISFAKLGVEYNVAKVNTFSLKIGIGF